MWTYCTGISLGIQVHLILKKYAFLHNSLERVLRCNPLLLVTHQNQLQKGNFFTSYIILGIIKDKLCIHYCGNFLLFGLEVCLGVVFCWTVLVPCRKILD